jgi:transcriptional regulator with XRE-family HTH domain
MNDPIWLAEDGRLLKDLRTAAGLDIHEFSRAASISAAQLRQLEEGGNELFYSQSIKFQMGRKLLLKLGADVVRVAEEPVAETPSLFGFSPSPTQSPSLEETLSAAPTPVLPTPEAPTQTWNKRWVPVLSGVGVLLLAGVFGAQLLGTSSEPNSVVAQTPAPVAPTPVVVTPTAATAVTASNEVAKPEGTATQPLTPTAPALAPTPVAQAPEPASPVGNSSACQWSEGPGNSFMPRGMEKPSTYVHLVASADANICIQDRNKKVTQVNLKAGEKITVRGSAPWRIQSPHWAEVQVYFQGYRMPVPASATLVTLNPRTEPLAEPSAQNN